MPNMMTDDDNTLAATAYAIARTAKKDDDATADFVTETLILTGGKARFYARYIALRMMR